MFKASVAMKVLIVGWIISLWGLYPLPSTAVEYILENRGTLSEIISVEAERQGQKLSAPELSAAVDAEISRQGQKEWTLWALRLASVIIGLLGAYAFLRHPRQLWLWAVIVAVSIHFVIWVWPFAAQGAEGLSAYISLAKAMLRSSSSVRIVEFLLLGVLLPVIELTCGAILTRTAVAQKPSDA